MERREVAGIIGRRGAVREAVDTACSKRGDHCGRCSSPAVQAIVPGEDPRQEEETMCEADQELHTGRVIREEVRIDVPPETLYRAWSDPEALASWFVGEMKGRMKEGETVTWHWGAREPGMTHRVLLVEPPHRLVTEMPLAQGPCILDVTIEEVEGGSRLRLIQSGMGEGPEWDDQYESMLSGWMIALAILKFVAKRYLGRPRREIVVLAEASFDRDEVARLQRTEEGLSRWLTRSGAPGEVEGRPVRLELEDGRTLTGTVLRTTPTETAWSWEEIDGVVELKAFRTPRWGSRIGLRVSSWMEDLSELTDLEETLSTSVEKLTGLLDEHFS